MHNIFILIAYAQIVSYKHPNPRGKGTLILSYIHRLGLFFWVQNFEFQYFLGFQKNDYCFGYEDFVDIFLGSSQNWTIIKGSFLCILGSHLKVKVQNGSICLVAKISNSFLGCLNFLIFFWG